MTRSRTLGALLLAILLPGCSADEPGLTAPAHAGWSAALARGIQFVHRAPHTPPFKDEVVTVAARAGMAASATLSFADGSPFARLTLSEETMRGATLKGRALGEGEVVTITLRRVDASRYLVDLQPSGLVFNASAPAELVFHYGGAQVAEHAALEVRKQERAGEAWLPASFQVDRAARRMHARVDDFTIYAMSIPH